MNNLGEEFSHQLENGHLGLTKLKVRNIFLSVIIEMEEK